MPYTKTKWATIPVRGVTYSNDPEDGGRPRQGILANIAARGSIYVTVDLNYTTYDGQPAIKVQDHVSRNTIGWIPKERIADVTEQRLTQLTGILYLSKKGIYSVTLDKQIRPDHETYAAMRLVCRQNGISMPAYDMRAYREREKQFVPAAVQ